MKLSVLDQAPISKGVSPEETLNRTLELAQLTESLGYHRYWIAEHHNTSGLASTSPEIFMTRLASVTKSIRIGSGGILLPQYSPFKVAENAKTLAGFFPGRIDIGVGSSPGGSELTRSALTDYQNKSLKDFKRQLFDLNGFLNNSLPKDHDFRLVKAGPRVEEIPPVFLLGLSERSAALAAESGLGFVFGHFIRPDRGASALKIYREEFNSTINQPVPKPIICIFIVCAETEEEAESHALTQDKWLLNVGKGLGTKVLPKEDIDKQKFDENELKQIRKNRKRCIVGTPEAVRNELYRLKRLYQTDEFMIITNIYDFEAKKKSYRLLSEAVFNK